MDNSTSFPINTRRDFYILGLGLSLLIPSLWVFEKYFGYVGVFVYVTAVFIGLFILNRYFYFWFVSGVNDKLLFGLIAVTFLLLLAVFYFGYPFANSGTMGVGSDRDEALNIATTNLLNGQYPYYDRTHTGNLISPMPGSLLLAVPFVMLGNSAYQNFLWLFAFLVSLFYYLKNKPSALLLLWVVFALSPVVIQEFITGGDLLANSLYVLLSILWLVSAVNQPGIPEFGKISLAVLLGVGLASRANFILLLPLVYSTLVLNAGWRPAMKYILITIITLALMILPFYLFDPGGFSPLKTGNKLARYPGVLPYAGIIFPLITGVTAAVLSFTRSNRSLDVLFRNCAVVMAIPVLSGTVLSSIQYQSLRFIFTKFGLVFLFFGAAAFWYSMQRTANEHLAKDEQS